MECWAEMLILQCDALFFILLSLLYWYYSTWRYMEGVDLVCYMFSLLYVFRSIKNISLTKKGKEYIF